MIGHLGINVPDLGRAVAYYDQILPLLGFETFFGDITQHSYRPADGKRGTYLFLYPAADPASGYSRERAGLQHLAFVVPTRTRVREVADAVAALGSEIVHAPREFPEYPPPYYATFWTDPHGFLLEAVCHHDRD
ncbi:VOC family protein [Rhodococcus maanshanensis]|uniref:Catechol 2,3-dioxygenase n=1 Tax=Rhodococcus maanshanensis TaxID=183556 RepID=A0A1H7VAJ3_9NOCA|nr:VOC family protein [Rhodococcus maanshanensis]SEM05958.1 Catechol 2,3-dioxygenase [Rhodococcus maanshanensis]